MNGRCQRWWSRACLGAALMALVLGCASGGGGDGGSGGGPGGDAPAACPSEEPAEGSACTTVGASCRYHGVETSSFCTSAGTWQSRVFAPEPGAPSLIESLADYVECSAVESCPEAVCTFGCCSPGAASSAQGDRGGCAACCQNKPCFTFSAKECPRTQCALVTDCHAMPVCVELSKALPGCALVGESPSQVECCQGLAPRCGKLSSFGYCDGASQPAPSSERPVCVACGDGTCEAYVENKCNCPEDCG